MSVCDILVHRLLKGMTYDPLDATPHWSLYRRFVGSLSHRIFGVYPRPVEFSHGLE